MKSLPLNNPHFKFIEESFREWLDILGYSEQTIYNIPNSARELLHWLEQKEVTQIKQIDSPLIKIYYDQLKMRANQRRGGGLANRTLNKHLQALQLFITYLNKVGRLQLPKPKLRLEAVSGEDIQWLTLNEITSLYHVTFREGCYESDKYPENFMQAMAARDRAMVTIFYGCGLRRNEGVNLDVSDINFDTKLLKVRKGKNYKERFVPLTSKNSEYLEIYLYDHRPVFKKDPHEGAFFLSRLGRRLSGQSLLLRLKFLQSHSTEISLQEKQIGLHSLRHSIATLLLQNGMPLEMISRFLGHSSLESTQVYTHLAKQDQEQDYLNIPSRSFIQLHEDEENEGI